MNSIDDFFEQNAYTSFIIFGAGYLGKMVYKYCILRNRKVLAFADNDKEKWNKKYKKVKIKTPIKLVHKHSDSGYIICNIKYSSDIEKQLLEYGIRHEQMFIAEAEDINNRIREWTPCKKENAHFIYEEPEDISWENYLIHFKKKLQILHYGKRIKNEKIPVLSKKKGVLICAIFKNEAVYLKEWIEYHKLIGVTHFCLYNNYSTDNYQEILEPYIREGSITLVDWPYKCAQMAAYEDCIEKYRNIYEWIGFIDIDEFIVPIDDDRIDVFLRKFKNRGSVLIYWKIFGSSGKRARDVSNLVIEDFTVSWKKFMDTGKCFYNTLFDFPKGTQDVFHHIMWTSVNSHDYPPVNCFNQFVLKGEHKVTEDHFPIQINHYTNKSLEEYESKKAKGDVYFKNNPHDDEYFLYHENKCGTVDYSIYKYLVRLKQIMDK